MAVPSLRFDNSSEWEKKEFSEFVKLSKNKHNPTKSDHSFKCLELESIEPETGRLLEVFQSKDQSSIKSCFTKGQVLFGKLRPYLRKFHQPTFEGVCSSEIWVLDGAEETDNTFIYYLIQAPKFSQEVNITSGSKMPRASWEYISSIKFFVPTLPEQRKIADFLSAVDEKIRLLTEKKEKLETYKKGVMQKLFPKAGQTNPELRFKRPDGSSFPDWEEKRFNEVFDRVTKKNSEDNQNVLTISAQQGLISQLEFFNKSVSASDLTGYYLLQKGDFAYNKSYSNGYPLGAIKRLDRYDKGVVSTLYICFRLINDTGLSYYEHYFDSGIINPEISKIAQEGARNHGLLNMSVVEFFKDIRIEIPCIEEQKRISEFLDELKLKIEAAEMELGKIKDFKKGLLQQMFV